MKCSCNGHVGKEMLNQVFSLGINYFWECLFGDSDFCHEYWENRKFQNFTPAGLKWYNISNNFPSRKLEYHVELGAFGRARNIEEQVKRKFLINL